MSVPAARGKPFADIIGVFADEPDVKHGAQDNESDAEDKLENQSVMAATRATAASSAAFGRGYRHGASLLDDAIAT